MGVTEKGRRNHMHWAGPPTPYHAPPPSCIMQIMVEMFNRHDWQLVLDMVLPPRKRADFKSTKAKAKEQADAAEEKHKAEEQVEAAAASEQQVDDMAAETTSEPKEQAEDKAKERAEAAEQHANGAKQHADVKEQVKAKLQVADGVKDQPVLLPPPAAVQLTL